MKPLIGLPLGLGASAVLALAHSAAQAQIPWMLPQNDFRWTWGKVQEGQNENPDIDVDGHDQGFECNLTAKLHFSTNMSMSEIRDVEMQLRQAFEFVRTAAEYMQHLDYQRDLDWAILDCKEPKPKEATEEERLERETKAREKMQREVERRRARQQKDAD
jgi:hypothetical protein